ncbi:MAG: 50S ribosomal protein L13e [Desulfurococcales archaeon]|nr:50S ribosomal protein L13e [Desulfurococcales archaeon]
MARASRLPEGVEPPVAMVKKPRLRKLGPIDPGLRPGRGFSRGELKAVGLTPKQAMKLGLYVDKRRKTVHPWNVEALKRFLEALRSTSQAEA